MRFSREWADRKETLFGYPCLTHRNNMNKGFAKLKAEHEKCLFGEKGQIYESSPGYFSVIIYTRNHGEKNIPNLPELSAREWVRRLGVPKQRGLQLRLAERFDLGAKNEQIVRFH